MRSFSTLFTSRPLRLISLCLALASITSPVQATPCLSFDKDFNLFAFGFSGKDFELGTQDTWSSAVNPTDITASGRPPFDGTQTTCYFAQFFNAIYVLDGDKSDPSAVYILNAADKTWSKQAISSGGPNAESLVTILDHDTNVFYALDGGKLSFLDMGSLTVANSTALSWVEVGSPDFDTSGYKPTMALAQNHIHFIGVPNTPDGNAHIFVIHFSFFQPEIQSYPEQGSGNNFPSTHGQTASFFKSEGVQTQFAFIPDDASATYIIDVVNNNTLPLAGPSDKSASTYAASINALVQLTETGNIFFLPYTPEDSAKSQAATWTKINAQGLSLSSGNSSSNGTSTSGTSGGSGSGSGASGTKSGAGASSTGGSGSGSGSGTGNNDAASLKVGTGMVTFIGSLLLGALVL